MVDLLGVAVDQGSVREEDSEDVVGLSGTETKPFSRYFLLSYFFNSQIQHTTELRVRRKVDG